VEAVRALVVGFSLAPPGSFRTARR
jgi:hypothetical protein